MKSSRLIVVSVLSQTISLLSLKVLTELVGIETYGLYLEVLSFTLVFQLISSLKLELGLIDESISVENDLKSVRDIRIVSILFNVFITGIVTYIFFRSILIALVVIITSFYSNSANASTYYDIGQNNFRNIIRYRFFRPILIFSLQYFLIQKFDLLTSLILGLAVGSWLSYHIGFWAHRIGFNDFGITALLRGSKRIVRYSLPSDILNSIGSQLPILFFSRFFGPDSATVYYTVTKVVITPYAILTESLTKILTRNFLNFKRSVFTKGLFKIVDVQLFLFLGGAILLIVFNGFIETLFLSEQGGDFALMSYFGLLLALSMFIAIPLLSFLNVTGNQHKDFGFQLMLLLFRSTGLFIGVWLESIEISILGYFLLSSVVYMYFARLGLQSVQIANQDINAMYYKLSLIVIALSIIKFGFSESLMFVYLTLSASFLFGGLRTFIKFDGDESN